MSRSPRRPPPRPGARRDLFSEVVGSLLDDGIAVRFRAGGRSMSPTVRDGEYVIVAPVDPRRVQAGDIVLTRTERGPLAHRLVSVAAESDGAERLTLCGDASSTCDRPVAADEIRGRVVSVERAGHQRSLAVVGGWLGRVALLTGLRLRRSILAARVRRATKRS